MIKVKFYGVRGSFPLCTSDFYKYGGNTTCIKVELDDEVFIIDAGTGIRNLGKDILNDPSSPSEIKILFSHLHHDHIQGLPYFEPSYRDEYSVKLMSGNNTRDELKEAMETTTSPLLFPIPFSKFKADMRFNELDHPGISIIALNHPGGCAGYKFSSGEESVVLMIDHEAGDHVEDKYIDFCKGVDLLVHDGQFTSDEYEKHEGWGHSNIDRALELAEKAGVKNLMLAHHDPNHNDEFLDQMERYCQSIFREASLAREGQEVRVSSPISKMTEVR